VIAAVAADELKRVGIAAFCPALHDAGRLAPQACRAAVAGLTSSRECRETLVVRARPRGTGIVRVVRYGNIIRTVKRPDSGYEVGVFWAHQSPPPARSLYQLPGSGAARQSPASQHDRGQATTRVHAGCISWPIPTANPLHPVQCRSCHARPGTDRPRARNASSGAGPDGARLVPAPSGRGRAGRRSPDERVEGSVNGSLGDIGEAAVVVAGVGPQPRERLGQVDAGAF
jgi:hypothetical protein